MTPYLYGETLNDCEFLLRILGTQKEVKQYFLSAEIKELPTKNPEPHTQRNYPSGIKRKQRYSQMKGNWEFNTSSPTLKNS